MDNTNQLITEIVEQIKNIRKEKNFTQRTLAYASKIPQSTVARIEMGKVIPTLDTLAKIAEVLEFDIRIEKKQNKIPEISRWDGLRFCAYWKDELVSKVSVTDRNVDITRFILHPVKQIFFSDRMDIFQLSEILEDRCWERGRADINDILRILGLKYYDPLEIVKKTHGVSYNDFLWFQFEGENYRYEDMRTRRCL